MSGLTRRIFIHILLPLLAGLVIYALFRKNTWLHQHLLPDSIPYTHPQNWLGHIIAFTVPDFCWSYSLASALFLSKGRKIHVAYTLVVLFILLAAEFVQYLFPGQFTFDWLDIVAALVAFSLSYTANRKNEKI